MAAGKIKAFMALGGNFLSASPDYEATKRALENCELMISMSTKLNKTHLCNASTVIILPTLTRVEKDIQQGNAQRVSVENSMGIVHASTGSLKPIRETLCSEPWIIAEFAKRVLAHNERVDWEAMKNNYALIREHIAAVVPGFSDYEHLLDQPNGFMLKNPAASRIFQTPTKKAVFMKLKPLTPFEQNYDLLLTTIRSHDQFNTAVYGMNDRYRGIKGQRDVVFMNPADISRLSLAPNMRVDLISACDDKERILKNLAVKSYEIKAGCAACYFPEANVLIPLYSVAHESNTPSSKQIPIRIRKAILSTT
jgi:anaerobic selenocysteine-containing dehydrogenase